MKPEDRSVLLPRLRLPRSGSVGCGALGAARRAPACVRCGGPHRTGRTATASQGMFRRHVGMPGVRVAPAQTAGQRTGLGCVVRRWERTWVSCRSKSKSRRAAGSVGSRSDRLIDDAFAGGSAARPHWRRPNGGRDPHSSNLNYSRKMMLSIDLTDSRKGVRSKARLQPPPKAPPHGPHRHPSTPPGRNDRRRGYPWPSAVRSARTPRRSRRTPHRQLRDIIRGRALASAVVADRMRSGEDSDTGRIAPMGCRRARPDSRTARERAGVQRTASRHRPTTPQTRTDVRCALSGQRRLFETSPPDPRRPRG